jgi:uncharacterized coiled-coil DUF342 family protein
MGMSCLSSSRRATLIARIEKKEAQLASLETAYDALIHEIDEYKFNSGEGNQQVKYKSLKQISDEITRLEAEIDSLWRKLNGRGIVNMNLRRKNYSGYFGGNFA